MKILNSVLLSKKFLFKYLYAKQLSNWKKEIRSVWFFLEKCNKPKWIVLNDCVLTSVYSGTVWLNDRVIMIMNTFKRFRIINQHIICFVFLFKFWCFEWSFPYKINKKTQYTFTSRWQLTHCVKLNLNDWHLHFVKRTYYDWRRNRINEWNFNWTECFGSYTNLKIYSRKMIENLLMTDVSINRWFVLRACSILTVQERQNMLLSRNIEPKMESVQEYWR